jgi:uncharacterized protein (TIGR02646 family)
MVRTRARPNAPAALVRNARSWTARWVRLASTGGGDWATISAKNALREPLLALTWGKCAFCEGALGAQAYSQIDHYVSRKIEPQRAFEWENLLPVCQICNACKGPSDHQGRLLKPDIEDPEPFFWIGPEGDITPHPALDPSKVERATGTIRLCNLNRGELCAARQEVADSVRLWLARSDAHTREDWHRLSNPRHPYKIVVRNVLTIGKLPQLAAFDRDLFQTGR